MHRMSVFCYCCSSKCTMLPFSTISHSIKICIFKSLKATTWMPNVKFKCHCSVRSRGRSSRNRSSYSGKFPQAHSVAMTSEFTVLPRSAAFLLILLGKCLSIKETLKHVRKKEEKRCHPDLKSKSPVISSGKLPLHFLHLCDLLKSLSLLFYVPKKNLHSPYAGSCFIALKERVA